MWHYIFSGRADLCHSPHHCYCGGFGVYFTSAAALNTWFDMRTENGRLEEAQRGYEAPDEVRWKECATRIAEMQATLEKQKAKALERELHSDLQLKALSS